LHKDVNDKVNRFVPKSIKIIGNLSFA